MLNRKAIFTFGAALCLGFTALAHAQEEAPGNLAVSWTMTPKNPVDGSDFEEALMKHIEWRNSKGDPRDWDIYQVTVGDNMGEYYVRACCFHWADQDAYQAWSQENAAGEHFLETVGSHISGIERHMEIVDMENSSWDVEEYTYVGVSSYTMVPGKQQQMSEAISTLSQLAIEHEWPRNWVWLNSLGGETTTSIASPYNNFADMAPPEESFEAFASQHMGEEETAAVMQSFMESIESSSYTIYVKRSDLSAD